MYHPLLVEKDVGIDLRDGTTLRADVFRPNAAGDYPVIATLGPYPKDIHFADWNPAAYETLPDDGQYLHWETVNPEWWVPQGYAVLRVDARGTGASAGEPTTPLSKQEAEDFHDVVEWAGGRSWSSGRVAVMGISYFAMNAWRVAAERPDSLAAIVPWEGAVDLYRDVNRHGGIYSNEFVASWSDRAEEHRTDDSGEAADSDRGSDDDASARGPPIPPTEYTPGFERNNPDLGAIEVPVLSAGNWSGAGLHLRGNTEGFLAVGSETKQLRIHSGNHVDPFYSLEGRLHQKRFLDRYLRDERTDVEREPPVRLAIRRGGDEYEWRYEDDWPIPRTDWSEFHLDAAQGALSTNAPSAEGSIAYDAGPDADDPRVRFATAPAETETEITGPASLALWVEASAGDADLLVRLRHLESDGGEVTYPPIMPGGEPVAAAYGWLRLSHRELDPERSEPYRPYHTHVDPEPPAPGEIVRADVEIWPTSVVLEPGHRLVVEVGAEDDPGFGFRHSHPEDRIRAGTVTIHTGGDRDSHLLLPVIPPR